MGYALSYRERVLLAALKIAEEHSGKRGYEFHKAKEDLILTPWIEINRERVYSEAVVRVTENEMFGSDETMVSELEDRLKTITPRESYLYDPHSQYNLD